MVLERVLSVQLDRQRGRQKGAADVGSRLGLTNLSQGRKERLVNRIAGLFRRLALEALFKLIEGQIQFLCQQIIGRQSLRREFDHSFRRATTVLKKGAGFLA